MGVGGQHHAPADLGGMPDVTETSNVNVWNVKRFRQIVKKKKVTGHVTLFLLSGWYAERKTDQFIHWRRVQSHTSCSCFFFLYYNTTCA